MLRGGIAWRLIPDSFPPWGTVYRWFARLRDDGTWETINHHLGMRDRERVGRQASPTAAVVDSKSVKTTESGGVRGHDAGNKIKGRERHAMIDTDELRMGRCCSSSPATAKTARQPRLSGKTDLAGLRAERLAVTKDCLATTGIIALDLTGARIDWLQYGGSGLLPRPLQLRRATVGLVEATPQDKCDLSLPAYTPFLDGALLSRLSRKLEEEGRPELSDQVLRTLRKRQLAEERARCLKSDRGGRALWLLLVDLLWRGFLDYGARPLRPLLFSAVLCAGLVAMFLDPRNVVPSTAALIIRQEAYRPAQSGPHKADHPLSWTA